MCTREPRLVLVSLLIGWKSGARTLNQSLSGVMQNQSNSLITLDTQLKTALKYHFLFWLSLSNKNSYKTTYKTFLAWMHRTVVSHLCRLEGNGSVECVACPQSPHWGWPGLTRETLSGCPHPLTAIAGESGRETGQSRLSFVNVPWWE